MDKKSEPGASLTTRRALLRRIGIASGLAYVAPALSGLGVARASGGSGGGSRGGGSGYSVPSRPSRPQRQSRQPARPAPAALPELVVLLPQGLTLDDAVAAGYRVLGQVENTALAATVARLGLPGGRSVEAARSELGVLLPGVLADANTIYAPNDFLCSNGDCAAQAMIGWSGWPSAMTPRIGMIDTGINTAHDALTGQRLTVFQADLGERASAGRQHGTAIAAMLVGRISGRVPGLLPHAELIAVEAFHRGGSGETADAFTLVGALDLLLAAGVTVINMSFSGPENAVLERMVIQVAEAGVGLVAAAGNGGPGAPPAYPAAWPQVVAVTAVDDAGQAYRQANRGPYVMLAAPGVNVWTAASISGGRLRSGTSYAVPFVTSVLAVERMRAPDMPLASVLTGVLSCARDLGEAGFDETYGHGLVSAPGQCTGTDSGFYAVSSD